MLKIDAEVFLRIVSENPDVALNVMRILSNKLARMTESVERSEVGGPGAAGKSGIVSSLRLSGGAVSPYSQPRYLNRA